MVGKPIAKETKVKDEKRIVIHTVCRDLLRVIAKRQDISMGKVVWNALAEHWLNQGYDAGMLFQILDPPCPTCGFQLNNPSEADRERLVEQLSSDGWEEYEANHRREQKEMDKIGAELGLDKKRCSRNLDELASNVLEG